MTETIPELVERFIQGDATAFAELVSRYQKRVYYLAFEILGSHLDADEVVQETFVRVYRRRKELSNVQNFTSFLIRVATNYSIDLLRKQRGRARVTDDVSLLPTEDQIELSRKVRTPGELFEDKVVMAEITKALGTLPPRQRLTAILHDVEGYTKSEIAQILGCPEATVRSNLHIARSKLKKILQKRISRKG